MENLYLEHTEDGHDKWWALLKVSGGYECWYGKRGMIHPKSTSYTVEQAQKKLNEKLGKGYKRRVSVTPKNYQDLVYIQQYGIDKFIRGAIHDKAPAKPPKTKASSNFDFMAELRKV